VRNTVQDATVWDEFTQGSWLWCRAVTRDEYAHAMETGFWADGKPARQMSDEEKLGIDTSTGGNNPPIEESLADQIAALVGKIEDLAVTDQASADAASGYLDKLRKLLELAEAARVREKEPFLEGGRQVDAKWSKVRQPGIDAGTRLKAARDKWLRDEQARLDAIAAEETRKRREEAERAAEAEAERLRKEAEQHGQPVDESEIAERVQAAVPVVEEVQPERARASSDFGRATTAKKTKRAMIVDLSILAGHFVIGTGTADKPLPDADFLDYMQKRADKAMRAKITLPGVEISEG
jgi:hypothetical protein